MSFRLSDRGGSIKIKTRQLSWRRMLIACKICFSITMIISPLQRALNWRNSSTKEGEAEKGNFQELLTSHGQKVHQRLKVQMTNLPCASSWRNTILNRWDIARIDAPIRTSKERQAGNTIYSIGFKNDLPGKEDLGRYICTVCPDDREMPGFEGVVAKWDRNKHGENTKEQRKSKKQTHKIFFCQLIFCHIMISHRICVISRTNVWIQMTHKMCMWVILE